MWTPKRIGLLILGLAVFVTAYVVYANVLRFGNIDGLAPLPTAYWPSQDDDSTTRPDPDSPPEGMVERLLRLAFGDGCEQVHWPFRIHMQRKNMAFAFKKYVPIDGNVELTPVSIALFNKNV